MRKIGKGLISLFLAGLIISTAACTGGGDSGDKGYDPYESIKDKAADAEFTFFAENLHEEQLYPLSSGGKTYYIASDGKTTNDGLSESTPKTIKDVSKLALGPGDNVLFKKGDVFESTMSVANKAGEPDNPITFASYGEGEERPHITYNKAADVMTFDRCSNIVVRDLEVSGWAPSFDVALNPAYNCINFTYQYAGSTKYEGLWVVNNVVHGTGDTPTERSLMGITVSSLERNPTVTPREVLKNVYIYKNHVYDIGRSGIHTSGWFNDKDNNQNNTFMDMFKNIYIDYNEVHDVGNIGIYIGACTNSTINRNLVYRTGMRVNSQEAEGQCGIMAIGADTMDIMYNICYDNRRAGREADAMGIDIDWNTTNINVQYNYCYENDGGGIGTMACQNSFIRNNRVENNRCITNQEAQIQVSNFTSRYACVEEDMHACKNVMVEENLILGTPDGKYMFKAQDFNGDIDWENNVFQKNHVCYTGDNVGSIYWHQVDTTVPWYKFDSNKYYSTDTSEFSCFDYTGASDINLSEGAQPYQYTKDFSSWQARELNATLEEYVQTAPSAPTDGNVTFENGELKITWTASQGNLWHYNVYAVKEGEDASYLNMLGETTTTSYAYAPKFSGTFYIVVQPESNQGVYGKAIKLKVTLM